MLTRQANAQRIVARLLEQEKAVEAKVRTTVNDDLKLSTSDEQVSDEEIHREMKNLQQFIPE